MKKNLFALVVMLATISSLTLNAQNQAFKKGNVNLSLGYGIVPTFINDGGSSNIPPLSARIGYALSNNINVSGYVGYSATTSKPEVVSDGILSKTRNDLLILGLRGEIHSDRDDKFDFYGGFMFGYNIPMVEETSVSDGSEIVRDPNEPFKYPEAQNNLVYSGFIGASYFFKPKMAAYTEVGYGVSLVNLGLTFKL
jgi:hypothetical protein